MKRERACAFFLSVCVLCLFSFFIDRVKIFFEHAKMKEFLKFFVIK